MTPPRLILASVSPRRRELLKSLGVEFEILSASATELHDPSIPVRDLCCENAWRKADAVAGKAPGALVLGADTLVALGGEVFGKPATLDEAHRMLNALQGRTHQVITGVCLAQNASRTQERFAVETQVTFRPLSSDQIASYIERVHVLDKAGAYAIQEHGDLIIEKISGSYSNVVGLPLEELAARLNRYGFRIERSVAGIATDAL
jgi:septum formation protein